MTAAKPRATISALPQDLAATAREALRTRADGAREAVKSPERLAVEAELDLAGVKGCTLEQLVRATGLVEDDVHRVLQHLVSAQKGDSLLRSKRRHWRLLSAVTREVAKNTQRTTPHVNSTTPERNWCPPWLKTSDINHSARVGAQDAFALPSRVGNALVPPRGIRATCTGPAPRVPSGRGGVRLAK